MILEFEKSERSLLSLIQSAVPGSLSAPCGGRGSCGKCGVRVWGRLRRLDTNKIYEAEGELLSACRYAPEDSCRVELEAQRAETLRQEGDADVPLGLAADIGSTTLELALISLQSGRELIRRREFNAQRGFGADVLSRVQALRGENGWELYSCLHWQIARMVGDMCAEIGANPKQVEKYAVCGNTIEEHFAAGLDPSGIAVPPFEPLSRLGLCRDDTAFAPGLQVYFCPCLSGYVGGDLIAGLSLTEPRGKELYMDIGTNGELCLAAEGQYLCCAAAAGPAFEGAELSCGMGGGEGAIFSVKPLEGDIALSVIGGGEARGICGSGAIEAVSAMLELGVIGRSGRFRNKERLPGALGERLRQQGGVKVFMLSDKVYISAEDIRKLQLAKAAVRAGTELMLRRLGISPEEICRISLAGGFGSAIDRQSAERIGLIPRCTGAELRYVGNAALEGAKAALTEEGRRRIEATLSRCSYAELSSDKAFPPLFLEYLNF